MKKIATIKIVKEHNYEVDIERLANSLKFYLDDALSDQFYSDECYAILEDDMRYLALLDEVGQVWHDELLKEIVHRKITSDKEIFG